jgi:hypothetical protein
MESYSAHPFALLAETVEKVTLFASQFFKVDFSERFPRAMQIERSLVTVFTSGIDAEQIVYPVRLFAFIRRQTLH